MTAESASAVQVPDEERLLPGTKESYAGLVRRLSHQSVVKHYDAYADIDWDAPENRIDQNDSRWELHADDVLGATAWYQSQPADVRARIGLHMFATFMKIGVEFESVLKRGLLEFAGKLPPGAPELRYVYHEVIEEAQHSLMFNEFVNRTGLHVSGLNRLELLLSRRIVHLGHRFPELFFLFVLGGEDPIDHVQRTLLRGDRPVHPLLKRIMQIHVTEEARHLCFARHYLRENVHRLSRTRRRILAGRAPFILGIMAQLMMRPSRDVIRAYAIPRAVIAEAYTKNPRHQANTVAALAKVRALCEELDIITPGSVRLWRWFGIWDAAPAV